MSKPSTILDYVRTFVCDHCHKPGSPSMWIFRGKTDERLCARCEKAFRASMGIYLDEKEKAFSRE